MFGLLMRKFSATDARISTKGKAVKMRGNGSKQKHLRLDDLMVNLKLARRLPAKLAFRHHALPVAQEKGHITVAMANPDDEMARLQRMRAELGVTETVTFLGSKDQEVLPNYYAAAEMVVMPSHYESFGMVALESLAMGTPVVASEVGGLAFLIQDGVNGFHVPSRDPESLAERILKVVFTS